MNQRIVAFSIVVIAAAWSLAGFGLTTDRENALKHAEQNGLNLARALAHNTARGFSAVDHHAIDIGRSGFVSIVGTDGVTRARAPKGPAPTDAVVENPALLPLYDRPEGCRPDVSRIDAVERLICFRRIDNAPLLVNVGLSRDEVLTDYYRARWRYLGAAAAITLIMALMAFWLVRHENKLVETSRALRESEYRSGQKSDILEITLENMSQGIFLIEPDGRISVINRRACELLDLPHNLVNEALTLDKLVEWQWESGEFGERGEAVDPELRSFLKGGALIDSPPVYVRQRPNGIVLEVRTIMLPAGGAVRTLSDITDYRRTQQQLAAAKEAAEAGYRSKSAFLATMSHEIRTPLNGVVGMASLLLESELTPEQRKSVETIQECSDALLELINDVLDFSKLEAGRLDVETRAFNLNELCEAVFNIIEARARSKSVTLIFAPSASLPAMIDSDSARLRQVLLNLVGNALKFTDSGAVILRVFPTEGGRTSGRIRFEVIDTGIGISEEAQARLFTEFTQVEASITRRYGGTGLGLAICKKIVIAMAGEIGVRSEIGKGSTFWFELPFTASDTAPSPLMQRVPEGCSAALIAEDDIAREVIGNLLSEIGLRVVATNRSDQIAGADVALVHVHHPVALDLIRGRVPAGAEKLQFLGYGFGSLTFSGKNFALIDGALTPSSVVRALAGAGIYGEQAPLPAAAAPKAPATAPKRSVTSLAILLAEDNAVNQRIASTMLINMGHTVDIAGNGRDAVAKATLRVYDVIIMDMQMPEMDGLEATRAIRALHGPEGHVPIVAMTANAFAADREACLAAGMNDFITKPITARKLFDAIEPWALGLARTHAEEPRSEQEEPAEEPPALQVATSANPDLIDVQQMQMIQDEVGSHGLHELLISFWADAGGLLEKLERALSAGDLERASSVLHTLKGAAASLGLSGCSHACEAARTAIAEQGRPDLNPLMTALHETLHATQPRILDGKRAAAKAA